ncbi:MAG: acyl-CoA dehydratase activase-related protein [Coriobacteriales bacterium]|nr:acyl-CoA dehydratase activase-related protein [Coriobacteriales bacterium]
MFLGIDSGSTATKVALINGDGHLLFSDRLSNRKDPIRACQILIDRVNLFLSVYPDAALTHCFVTGYGADSICLAIGANEAISETIAHALAAQTLFPEAQAVLDIGGQDIKLITFDRDRFGEVRFCDSCSSGCGIFMETLLHELDEDDAFLYSQALTAQKPVDFGSRCTVFMNTSIKQARQRGSSDADILAGLCYSIVQNAVNALMGDLGVEDSSFFLVAQGGLLENDAILRALEITLGHAVMRPAHASCMGAFGAALFALKTWSREKKKGIFESVCLLDSPHTTITRKCNLCSNACLLNETSFDNGRSFVSGNRCEKGAGSAKSNSLPNLFAYRNKRVFGYDSLSSEDAPRGSMGLIRALEMYDHYPFWHTLFTTLGYRVVISAESSKSILVKGMDTIPSESVCYPAKLSHGHVVDLIEKGVDSIFIPSVDEAILVSGGTAHPCPVITDYPHVLAANISNKRTKILHVTVSFVNDGAMAEALSEAFPSIPQKEIFLAIKAGFEELRHFHKDMSKQGEKALKYLEYSGSSGLVLLGKAYHTDPQIAHGIDTLAMQEGFAVLSADSIAHLTPAMDETHVDWSTSEQLLAAAFVVARYSCLEAVHLTSFGCLSDAVVSERLKEVLHASNKTYSQIKLDGGMNISSARIRLRSIKDQARLGVPGDKGEAQERLHSAQVDAVANGRFLFLPMIPTAWLEPIEHIFSGRFRCVRPTRASVEQCLRTGRHLLGKDACNPVAIMVGQTVETLRGDPRAGICILAPPQAARCCDGGFGYLMRRAFKFAGIEDLDVVEADSIASLAVDVLDALAAYLCFEDLLRHMSCLRRDSQGKHREVTNRWRSKVCKELARNKRFDLETVVSELIDDPAWSAHSDKKATFIGITGEILTSLSELQGELIEQILQKGGTPVPSPVSLWLYWHLADLSVRQLPASIDSIRTSLMGALKRTMGIINEALLPRSDILPVAFPCANSEQENRSEMSSLGNRYVIEDIESLLRRGVYNILCLQPVSCLPNHARGRGCLKNLLEHYPKLNMLSLDYSSKTNTINLLNRIIMFMGVAEDRATEKG